MKSLLIVCAAVLGLTGCGNLTKFVQVKYPPIPANLTAECPPLPPLTTGLLPELGGFSALDSLMYNDCAMRHKLLAERVKARESK